MAQGWNISWIGEMMSIRKCWLALEEEATLFPFFSHLKKAHKHEEVLFLVVYFIAKNILTSDSNILNTPKSKQFSNINFQAFSMWEMAVIWKMDENGWRLLANLPSASFSDFEDNRVVVRVDLED